MVQLYTSIQKKIVAYLCIRYFNYHHVQQKIKCASLVHCLLCTRDPIYKTSYDKVMTMTEVMTNHTTDAIYKISYDKVMINL